jgi:hypothetical protein
MAHWAQYFFQNWNGTRFVPLNCFLTMENDMSENEDKTGQQQTGNQGGGPKQNNTSEPAEKNVNIPKNQERRSSQTPGSGGEGG